MSAFLMKAPSGECIIEPTEFVDEFGYDDPTEKLDGSWQWGINIMYMLKHNYLKYLYISRMIRYKERYVFKEYIDTLYSIRL